MRIQENYYWLFGSPLDSSDLNYIFVSNGMHRAIIETPIISPNTLVKIRYEVTCIMSTIFVCICRTSAHKLPLNCRTLLGCPFATWFTISILIVIKRHQVYAIYFSKTIPIRFNFHIVIQISFLLIVMPINHPKPNQQFHNIEQSRLLNWMIIILLLKIESNRIERREEYK